MPVMNVFPQCVAKGSRFTLGVWGLSSPLLSCSHPSATVCDDCAMAVPLVSAAKVVTFGGFKRCVTSFRVADMALRDIPTCFTK